MSEAKHVMPFPGLTVDAERYMLTPASNEEGYNRSSVVSFVGGVDHSKHFLLVHGSGDDNVHFQNSLKEKSESERAPDGSPDVMEKNDGLSQFQKAKQ